MKRLVSVLLALAGASRADLVDRQQVTLGALADGSDRIVLARLAGHEPAQVRFEVQDLLKGRNAPVLHLPRGKLAWPATGTFVLFLDEGEDGSLLALSSAWQRVLVPDAAARDHLLAVVRGRLPSVGGDPRGLESALFAQLESPLERVREDAGLELLARTQLAPGNEERAALRRALVHESRTELLELAARLPEPTLLAPLLRAGRTATRTRERTLAGAALRAVDPVSAQAALERDLESPAPEVVVGAAHLLGALGGAPAERVLARLLADGRAPVRAAALSALAVAAETELHDPAPLLDLARGPDRAAARKALAILARAAAGAALKQLETELQDPELKALAAALRKEPVDLPRKVLAE